MSSARSIVAAALVSVLLPVIAAAVPISIVNPGFETPDLLGVASLAGSGWNGSTGGILDWPSTFGSGSPPEGQQALDIEATTVPGPSFNVVTQILSDSLQAGTTYTLTAQVGAGQNPGGCTQLGPGGLCAYGGYTLELVAGGVVLASVSDLVVPSGYSQFALATLTYPSGPNDPQAGQLLEIRLNLGAAAPSSRTLFDDVRLDATVPEPSVAALALASVMAVGGVRAYRRTNPATKAVARQG